MKRIATILNWTALGALLGYTILGTYIMSMMLIQLVGTTGVLPPDVVEYTGIGTGIGLLVGLSKAGVRVYLK